MRPQGCVGIDQKLSQAQQETQSNILLAVVGLVSSYAIDNKTKGNRIRRGFRCLNAHAE